MRERDRFQRGVLRAPEDVRGAGTSPDEGNTKSGETKELGVLDRAFHDFLYETRIKKIPRERAIAKAESSLHGEDLKEFQSTTEWYGPVFDALDEYDRRMKQQGARQGDVRAWALRGLNAAGIEEFDRIYDDVYQLAQEQPLGEHYTRKAQDVPAPAVAAGTTEREMLSSGRRRESIRAQKDAGRAERRIGRSRKREFIESAAAVGTNSNSNGNEENAAATTPVLEPSTAHERVARQIDEDQARGRVEFARKTRERAREQQRVQDGAAAELPRTRGGRPADSLYEAQTQPEADVREPVEHRRFMNATYGIDPETGKAQVRFRDGRREEVEDGQLLKFVNKRGETRRMIFDAGSGGFMERDRYERMLHTENERFESSPAQREDTEQPEVEAPKATLEPFSRIKPPDPKEFKLITDELAADTSARFAEGSKLLAEIAAKEKPETLMQTIQNQLSKIAEVDRRGFERIKLRVGALASFEKGEYKTLKTTIAALGRRFGVRAEIFDRLAEEKDSKARRDGFRVEIELSLGTLGRVVNFLTRRLYSRWRARSFDSTSRALNRRAENALQEHQRSVGAELGTVIGRNRTIREFFSALLKKDKDKSAQEEENIEGGKLAA